MLINLQYFVTCECVAASDICVTFEEYLQEADFLRDTVLEYLTKFFPHATKKGKIRVLQHYDDRLCSSELSDVLIAIIEDLQHNNL